MHFGTTRRFVAALTGSLLVSATLMLGAPSGALANSDCNDQTSPFYQTANLKITQSLSLASNGTDVVDHMIVTDQGPCPSPNGVVVVTLPAGALFVAESSVPSSWTPSPAPTDPPSAPGTITFTQTNTIGTPGNQDIYATYRPVAGGATTVFATVSGSLFDPDLSDNTTAAGYLTNGGSVTYGPGGNKVPTGSFQQTTDKNLPAGAAGSIQIAQLTGCPGASACIGKLVSMSGPASTNAQFNTFSFDAAITNGKSATAINVYWRPSSTAQFKLLGSCNGKPSFPCVSQRSKGTSNALASPANPKGLYYFIVVTSFSDDDYGFD